MEDDKILRTRNNPVFRPEGGHCLEVTAASRALRFLRRTLNTELRTGWRIGLEEGDSIPQGNRRKANQWARSAWTRRLKLTGKSASSTYAAVVAILQWEKQNETIR